MLWRKCVVRGAVTGLITGIGAGVVLSWLHVPGVGALGFAWITALTTVAGGISGVTTLAWLRGARQAGGKLSPVRAGIVSGLIAGGIVGAGATFLAGLVTGGAFAAAASAVAAGAATGALTAVAGIPTGCTVKGWIASE